MKLILIAAVALSTTTGVFAQHAHHSSANTEVGQSQFAAIAEIVAMLREDADTDWDSVDIDALRSHLVDMDNVTTSASVQMTEHENGVAFKVTGEADVIKSIQKMIMAHSPMLQRASGWTVKSDLSGEGATMSVETASIAAKKEVLGLGFFGLMTIGAHHQQHHLMIAKGHSPH